VKLQGFLEPFRTPSYEHNFETTSYEHVWLARVSDVQCYCQYI